jgi:hypothetical protein
MSQRKMNQQQQIAAARKQYEEAKVQEIIAAEDFTFAEIVFRAKREHMERMRDIYMGQLEKCAATIRGKGKDRP